MRRGASRRSAPYAGEVTCSLARARSALAVLLGVLLTVTTGAATASADDDARGTVVVLGTAGLRWADLDPVATPALTQLAAQGSVGSLVSRSVRTVSCPADGWLALSAGNRAGDTAESGCRELTDPAVDGAVPRWDSYLAERDSDTYGSRLGLLGSALAAHGVDALGVGPGAAIALADPEGAVVGRFESLPADAQELTGLVDAALGTVGLVVVDLGAVLDAPGAGARQSQVAVVEARAAAVLAALGRPAAGGSTVLLASLADGGLEPRLQVLVLASGDDGAPRKVLRSSSTRQEGFVLATDVLPTLLSSLGLEDAAPEGALVGSPARGSAVDGDRVAAMVDLDRHSTEVRELVPGFFAVLILANLVLYAAVWLHPARRFRVAGVAVGALPVATFLANLLPWWRAGAAGLYVAVAAFVVVVTAGALLGPWRGRRLGPLTAVAAVTSVTIVADVLTGSQLQLGSPMGVHPLVAGRFYGLNNSAFALLMVSSLLVAAVVGARLAARGRRASAVWAVATIGVVVTVVDGMPGLGSDFGGPPALVPAFAVLALRVAGARVGWRRFALVLGGGVAVVSAFAFVDWLRPQDARTHLGRFVQTVLDGGLTDVIGRKLAQNLEILTGSWLVLLAGVGVALVVWLLGRSRRTEGGYDLRDVPALRAALPAVVTGLVIGFAVNDSGIVIPAIGISLAVPLTIATLTAGLRKASDGDVGVSAPSRAPRPA